MRNELSHTPVRSYRRKVMVQAESLLQAPAGKNSDLEFSRALRRFLKIEDRRLRMRHQIGDSGMQTATARSFVVDLAVDHAFQYAVRASGAPHPVAQPACALVATGGYGRAELAPFSDVDLLCIYSGSKLTEMKQVSETLLRLLWDAGVTVGHSFRTVGDCCAAGLEDPHLRTALVSTRLIAGSKALHNSLLEVLEKDRRRHAESFIAAICRELEIRYRKFGDAVCLQEPNLKETAGGLRDYHTGIWLAYARYGYRTLNELRAHELVNEVQAQRVVKAYDFLWRVRQSAHFLTHRKTERVALDLQTVLAKQLGYRAGKHLVPSERLMRDYYRHARELHLFCEMLLAQVTDTAPRVSRWRPRPSLKSSTEPFSIRSGRLQFDGEAGLFEEKPLTIFNAFALAQAARTPLGFRLRAILTARATRPGKVFRGSPELIAAFFKLLHRHGRTGYVLRLMHDVGFLSRIIPEFGGISLLVQHDLYHHFTVDEHTLRAIETLDELYLSNDKHRSQLRTVFNEIKQPVLLYLALLLHDVGKSGGRGHIARGAKLAERACRRLQLTETESKTVVLLVKLHVAMAQLAQRRDLNEPQLIGDFATKLGSLDLLNMLLLLTYADLNAVGPGVWSDWKGSLLWDLYRRTRAQLTGAELVTDDGATLQHYKEEIAGAATPPWPLSQIERHLALLPERYQRITVPAAAAGHMMMIETAGKEGCALNWNVVPGGTELVVCAPDRHGLFADLAGTLAAHGIEILSAELNTREDGVAIDQFILRQASTGQAIEQRQYKKLELALKSAAAGELAVAELIERWRARNAPRKRTALVPARRDNLPRIVFDNDASPAATLVEVHAVDEPGLAYKIASALASLNLEIVCARIATERSDALDVFYVTNSDGTRVSEAETEMIGEQIRSRLSTTDAVSVAGNSPAMEKEVNEKSRRDYQTALA
jgi:[protein-PII] uridylyltransferase